MDVLVVDSGGKVGRHIKILVQIDLTQPLARGWRREEDKSKGAMKNES